MIRFKCIYCGQRIFAKDDAVGKRGKCPKCSHMLFIPKNTKGRPAISVEKEPMPEKPKPYIPAWQQGSGFDQYDASDELTELGKESFGFFIPTYDELSLFLMAVTLILLYAGNGQMRSSTNYILTQVRDGRLYVLGLLFLPGFALSLYHVFTRREKTWPEKWATLFFAVLTNAVTGIISGWYVIKNGLVYNWLLVFPIWNIINSVLLLLMLRFRIIDEECISDRDATMGEVVFGLAAVLIIFTFCNSVFHLYWAITFSICIIYTTSFDGALQKVFPGLDYEEGEQPA